MNRMGLDVALTHLGVAIVDDDKNVIDAKSIVTKKEKGKGSVAEDNARRCSILANGLWDMIDEHNPERVYVELPTGGAQDASSARAMGLAVGAVVAVLTLAGVKTTYVTPTDSKKVVGGNKESDKNFVKNVIRQLLNWKCKRFNEHVADAAAAVLSGMKKEGLQFV